MLGNLRKEEEEVKKEKIKEKQTVDMTDSRNHSYFPASSYSIHRCIKLPLPTFHKGKQRKIEAPVGVFFVYGVCLVKLPYDS